MSRLILFLIFILFLFQCTPAPRYHYREEPERKTSRGTRKSKSADTEEESSAPDEVPLLTIQNNDSAILTSSYYGRKFHGRRTSNGEIFNMYGYSAAHKELPFGTVLKVTYLKSGKSVLVTINDRGPFIKGRDLDLSYMAAKKIGLLKNGVGKVKIRVVKWGEFNE